MKTKFTLILLILSFLVSGFTVAQQVRVAPGDGVKIKDVEYETQQTPEFQAGNVKSKKVPNPRDWLELEVEFEIAKVDPRDTLVVPELLFRYYIGFKDTSGKSVVLTGDTTFEEVLVGEQLFAAVYVSPSTLSKITGEPQRFNENAVAAVGVEVFYNGVLVGGHSSGNGKFWETLQKQPGVLAKDKTPFALLWLDRYPAIKTSAR